MRKDDCPAEEFHWPQCTRAKAEGPRPKGWSRDQGSGIRGQGSGVRDQRSGIRGQGSGTGGRAEGTQFRLIGRSSDVAIIAALRGPLRGNLLNPSGTGRAAPFGHAENRIVSRSRGVAEIARPRRSVPSGRQTVATRRAICARISDAQIVLVDSVEHRRRIRTTLDGVVHPTSVDSARVWRRIADATHCRKPNRCCQRG